MAAPVGSKLATLRSFETLVRAMWAMDKVHVEEDVGAVRVKAVVAGGRHAAARVCGSGLRTTWPTGVQFRVPRDQRSGFAPRARV
jgi:hypothetical protein